MFPPQYTPFIVVQGFPFEEEYSMHTFESYLFQYEELTNDTSFRAKLDSLTFQEVCDFNNVANILIDIRIRCKEIVNSEGDSTRDLIIRYLRRIHRLSALYPENPNWNLTFPSDNPLEVTPTYNYEVEKENYDQVNPDRLVILSMIAENCSFELDRRN